MARRATSLVAAPALPDANQLEILIAEARLLHQPVGLDPSEESLLTVLLSFSPTDSERRAARALTASFIAANCTFVQPPHMVDLGLWIAETLHQLPASGLSVIAALPDYSREVEQQLVVALDVISSGHHKMELAVGVATSPADWAGCAFDGFVLVEPEQRCTDALRMFSAFTAMMAPEVMPCLDADDFRCALGTSANPSRLTEMIYLVSASRLLPIDPNGQRIMQGAVGVAVVPSRFLRPANQALLAKSVRRHIQPGALLTLVAPWGLTVEPPGPAHSVSVLLLCSCGDS